MQKITDTWSVGMRPTLWHAYDVEGGELMPILVICDGMHSPHGEILLKRTLAYVATNALV